MAQNLRGLLPVHVKQLWKVVSTWRPNVVVANTATQKQVNFLTSFQNKSSVRSNTTS